MSSLDSDISACNQAGGTFQDKLAASLNGLLNANKERKSEVHACKNKPSWPMNIFLFKILIIV